MKPLTYRELEELKPRLQVLVGRHLREIVCSERDLGLGFWGQGQLSYLWVDLSAAAPCAFVLPQVPAGFKKQKAKPVVLFLRAHAQNGELIDAELSPNLGRLIRLNIRRHHPESDSHQICEIEIRLFPHGQNVLVEAGEKFVSWLKPRPLPEGHGVAGERPERSYEQLLQQWEASRSPGKKNQAEAPAQAQAFRQKKLRALANLKKEYDSLPPQSEWRKRAEQLMTGEVRVSELDLDELDVKKSKAWNINRSFELAKIEEQKCQKLAERIAKLERELQTLAELPPPRPEAVAQTPALKRPGIPIGPWQLIMGKSAKDNLNMLRQARSWHYWIHLKDYPGSFGILIRQRQDAVTQEAFRQAAQEVASYTFGRKRSAHIGERLDVVIAECRYVRPIKGDRLGRVNYQNAQTLQISIAD